MFLHFSFSFIFTPIIATGETYENYIRKICRNQPIKFKDSQTASAISKSFLLHNSNPYLKMGPQKLEVIRYLPFRSIIRGFFTDSELELIRQYASPHLSYKRIIPPSTKKLRNIDVLLTNQRRSVGKAVQMWISDINYNETQHHYLKNEVYKKNPHELKNYVPSQPPTNRIYAPTPLRDPYSYHIVDPTMYIISKRIELVT